ncbi:hypothetical protein NDU88_003867 [Pleurodeles waltl]|uniref:Uncharacterized protein n=1 Tax=Pleurodeles waltl TaxID=8319 RepID=A0AAV7V1W9_PLEWA|nr:hypothetical protein NDU88_003867 [Pleurodeles waltl]
MKTQIHPQGEERSTGRECFIISIICNDVVRLPAACRGESGSSRMDHRVRAHTKRMRSNVGNDEQKRIEAARAHTKRMRSNVGNYD